MSEVNKQALPLLRLSNDYIFRRVFGDERNIDDLSAFIRSTGCLGKEELADLRIVDPREMPDHRDGKESILDVLARTVGGDIVHIEIQLLYMKGFRKRVVYYMARKLADQLDSGEEYAKISRVISIIIVNWDMSEPDGRYHKVFHIRERESGEMFSDVLELHLMELTRLPAGPDGTELFYWLKMISAKEEEEMEMLALKTPELNHVYSRIIELSADESERMRAEAREKARRDEAARISGALEKGLERGREEGLEQGRVEGLAQGRVEGREEGVQSERSAMVRRMLKLGIPIGSIAEIALLPAAEIGLLREC